MKLNFISDPDREGASSNPSRWILECSVSVVLWQFCTTIRFHIQFQSEIKWDTQSHVSARGPAVLVSRPTQERKCTAEVQKIPRTTQGKLYQQQCEENTWPEIHFYLFLLKMSARLLMLRVKTHPLSRLWSLITIISVSINKPSFFLYIRFHPCSFLHFTCCFILK